MLIGITGRISSGKGEVAEYFKNKGFIYLSLSQEVREEAARRNIEIKRKSLQDLGNLMRQGEGAGVLAKRVSKKITPKNNYVVDGIRNPAEVDELRKLGDFYLVAINASKEVRFKRVLDRAKLSDPKTWAGFLKMDNRDFGEQDSLGQQVGKCMKMADFLIINDLGLKELNKKIEEIYNKLIKMIKY